jgi:hypothetical protein
MLPFSPADLRRFADSARSDARALMAIAASIEPRPDYLTFGPPLANAMRSGYEQMADKFLVAAEQALSMASDLEQVPA